MKYSLPVLLLATYLPTAIADTVHWQYQGEHGPEHWGAMTKNFSTCSTGVNQSPIDITQPIEANLSALRVNYQKNQVEVVNNGHTIQTNIAKGSNFINDVGTFALKQFHFHSPSENTINGQSFPLEAHFVHTDSTGKLAVIGVMFKEGNTNQALSAIWENIHTKTHDKLTVKDIFNPSSLLPAKQDYFRFNGSLTTPPCSEGVSWFVMQDAIEASKAQITQFRQVMGGDTNRPVQAVNARLILQ